jgi:sugar fermentation stimulation protein A
MRFDQTLQCARLSQRYKRFLADVVWSDGSVTTCHCPNTGSMLGCTSPDSRIWLSYSGNPRRKYAYTWELVEVASGALVGIHTGRTNSLIREAIEAGMIPELGAYDELRPEVDVPNAPMRADFRLRDTARGTATFVEVKNVTAAVDEAGVAVFPDAVSDRGRRHLEVLTDVVRHGYQAATIFCAQRADVTRIEPADTIDPAYGRALREAAAAGVDLIGLGASVSPDGIVVDRRVPVRLPPTNTD